MWYLSYLWTSRGIFPVIFIFCGKKYIRSVRYISWMTMKKWQPPDDISESDKSPYSFIEVHSLAGEEVMRVMRYQVGRVEISAVRKYGILTMPKLLYQLVESKLETSSGLELVTVQRVNNTDHLICNNSCSRYYSRCYMCGFSSLLSYRSAVILQKGYERW